eukprot:gene3733-7416_t
MLGLVDYGSSDDEEMPIADSGKATLAPPPNLVSQSDKEHSLPIKSGQSFSKVSQQRKSTTKRSKKLDVSFLPVEIQKALARGTQANDSDSDDDGSISINKSSSSISGNLLAMLPQPKITQGQNINVTLEQLASREPKEILRNSKSTEAVYSSSHQLDQDNSDDDENDNSHHYDGIAHSTPRLNYAQTVTVPKELTNTFISTRTITSAPDVSCPGAPRETYPPQSSTTRLPPPTIVQIQNQTIQNTTTYNQIQSKMRAEISAPAQRGKTSRKRDRDIEQELLQGNISAVEEALPCVQLQANVEPWNPYLYGEQQKREAQLTSAFNFGQNGKDQMISQPTKLQNKRHQINSLAFNAAQIELELLDAKGARMKTKSETQAKYG